jgi:hypothetical protein
MKLTNQSPPYVDYEGRTPDSKSNHGARVIVTLDTDDRRAWVRTLFDNLDGEVVVECEEPIDYLIACDITNHPPT